MKSQENRPFQSEEVLNESDHDGIDDVVEELDIEASSGLDRKPRAKIYRVRIDKQHFRVNNPEPTGSELLALAGKSPVTNYMLFLVEHGGHSREVSLQEPVDLRRPGVEKFRTLPRDQQEG